VRFDVTGYETTTRLCHILSGQIKDKLLPSVVGVGIVGDEDISHNGKLTREYVVWKSMLLRCYDKEVKIKQPTYTECETSENFKHLEFFNKWCNTQVGFNSVDDHSKPFVLDKDVLIKGNKLYSEDTCCFVPSEVNVALTRAKNNMIIFKKVKSSVFDILNMKPVQIGTIIESQNISKIHKEIEKISYIPLDLGTQEKQISKEKEYEEDYLKAKYFGIATHYCLEMMDDFKIDNLNFCLNLAKTRYSNYLDENDFFDIKNRITLLINDEKFSFLIKDSKFITEQSLVYKEEIKIIDLLLFKDNNYYIIDYKTTKEKSTEHITQVSYYKKAIKDIFKTQNVFSYLVYLQKDEISFLEV
jgi:ATP-dependent exoDNAse (exonuclease V) beta subunit